LLEKIYSFENGVLKFVHEEPFADELEFQNLLVDHPDLLSGELVNPDYPRKWLLLQKEQTVPDGANPSKWFSLDHLFIDQDAIPTLVEVKRSSDTRARREVVGQMMDYAANGVEYWSIDQIRENFEKDHPDDPQRYLANELGLQAGEQEYEDFWALAVENFSEKKVRLLFVVDRVPKELRRIVEFLNETMRPTEVLAIELKRFVGGKQSVIVPKIFGQTTIAERVKTGRAGARKPWPLQRISGWLVDNAVLGNAEHQALRHLFDLSIHLKIFYPTGSGIQPGFASRFVSGDGLFTGWKVRSNNNGPQYWMSELAGFPDQAAYVDVRKQLVEIGLKLGVELNEKDELIIDLEALSDHSLQTITAISTQLVGITESKM
jgi:hypothetical protein